MWWIVPSPTIQLPGLRSGSTSKSIIAPAAALAQFVADQITVVSRAGTTPADLHEFFHKFGVAHRYPD